MRSAVWLGVLCAFLLVAATGCRNHRQPLPTLGHIADFTLTNQRGETVHASDLQGKVWVAAFIFTRCPTICPRITRRMQDLQGAAKQYLARVELVSFSVDPEYDTPPVLTNYAREFGLDTGNWQFLTGDSDLIKRTANESFKISVEGKAEAGAEHLGIGHDSHLVLIDKNRNIRGFYRSSDEDVVGRLVTDVKRLNAE